MHLRYEAMLGEKRPRHNDRHGNFVPEMRCPGRCEKGEKDFVRETIRQQQEMEQRLDMPRSREPVNRDDDDMGKPWGFLVSH